MSLAIASAVDWTSSLASDMAALSPVLATALPVFGGVRDGERSVRKLSALATSSMCATDVNSASVPDAAAWLTPLAD